MNAIQKHNIGDESKKHYTEVTQYTLST